MHETKHPLVKGYIDSTNVQDEYCIIKGWCFHTEKKVCPLRVMEDNEIEGECFQNIRNDVAQFYNDNSIQSCGWTIVVMNRPLGADLQIQIDGSWETVFRFGAEKRPVLCTETNPIIPSFVVVDNFYKDPDSVRTFALEQPFHHHPDYHKGRRTDTVYRFPGLKERFETILGYSIKNWEHYGTNCCFQHCIDGDEIVYHFDGQEYAGVLFLTPDAPPDSGTTFFRSKYTKKMKTTNKEEYDITFQHGFLDPQGFEVVDVVGNVYNRIVLFDAKMIHAASSYFGSNLQNSRLFQLFFFDIDKPLQRVSSS